MATQRKQPGKNTATKAAAAAAKKAVAKLAAPRASVAADAVSSFDTATQELEAKVKALLEENRRLGEELAVMKQQSVNVERLAADAVSTRAKVEKELQSVQTKLSAQTTQLAALTSENSTLTAQVKRLNAQVRSTTLSPLSPEEASALIQKTIGGLQTDRFQLADIDLTLKVATAKVGTEPVLVFPQPGSADPNTTHEIKLKLRNPAAIEEALKIR